MVFLNSVWLFTCHFGFISCHFAILKVWIPKQSCRDGVWGAESWGWSQRSWCRWRWQRLSQQQIPRLQTVSHASRASSAVCLKLCSPAHSLSSSHCYFLFSFFTLSHFFTTCLHILSSLCHFLPSTQKIDNRLAYWCGHSPKCPNQRFASVSAPGA